MCDHPESRKRRIVRKDRPGLRLLCLDCSMKEKNKWRYGAGVAEAEEDAERALRELRQWMESDEVKWRLAV